MRHGILGPGGVGGLLAGAFARAGRDVVMLMRPASLATYGGQLHVESVLLGTFDVDVPAAGALDRSIEVLWVTPKATQLESALELAPPDLLEDAVVVPLLNGVDHVALLRERLGADRVVPAAIYVESERADVGRIQQKTAFAAITLAPHEQAERICTEVREAGLTCDVGPSEAEVLWRKLAVLAPIALTTTALEAPLSRVVADPEWRRRLEVAARRHAIGAPATQELVAQIEAGAKEVLAE